MFHKFKDFTPEVHDSVFVAKNATIIGDVVIGEDCSIWFQTVIRGDVAPTRIGKRVNIQDLSMIHQSDDFPVEIEDDVTVGHQVTLHGCTIRKNALVGMGAQVLDGAEIGQGAFVGAGSLVTPGTKIPPNKLAVGRPARVVRDLTDKDLAEMKKIRERYVERGRYYNEHTNLGMKR